MDRSDNNESFKPYMLCWEYLSGKPKFQLYFSTNKTKESAAEVDEDNNRKQDINEVE